MDSTIRIFLLRHGQTAWNVEERRQGQSDSALTSVGRHQALENGVKLKKLLPARFRVISSPLGRCRETSKIVASTLSYEQSDIEYDSRLKEISFGSWEGRRMSEVEIDDPANYKLRSENRWDVAPPGGESYAMVAKRLQSWVTELSGPQTLVVVSHGCAGRILRGIFVGLAPNSIYTLDEPHDGIYLLEKQSVSRVG